MLIGPQPAPEDHYILSAQRLSSAWTPSSALAGSMVSVANDSSITIKLKSPSHMQAAMAIVTSLKICQQPRWESLMAAGELHEASLTYIKDRALESVLDAPDMREAKAEAAIQRLWSGTTGHFLLVLASHCARAGLLCAGDKNSKRLMELIRLARDPKVLPGGIPGTGSSAHRRALKLVDSITTDLQRYASSEYGGLSNFVVDAARNSVMPVVHAQAAKIGTYSLFDPLTNKPLSNVLDWNATVTTGAGIQSCLNRRPPNLGNALWELHKVTDYVYGLPVTD